MQDQAQQHGLTSTNQVLLGYDLVSVTPANDKVLHAVVMSDSVDIISLDFSARLPFHIKLTPVKMAIDRGVMFEVCYSAGLKDSTARRHLISNCLHLFFLTRGRNVIFSSGASRALDMRNPHEVMNLAVLFGLKGPMANSVISSSCYSVFKHAETRKTMKAALSLKRCSNNPIETTPASKKQRSEESADSMEYSAD
jgi:ribonuclease P/MRP protein subunit RPP1